MNHAERNELLSRILSGEFRCVINGKTYVVKTPTAELIYEANVLHKNVHYKVGFSEDWFNEKELTALLFTLRLTKVNIDDQVKIMTKSQDDVKLALFEAALQPMNVKKFKAQLTAIRKKIDELLGIQHMYDYVTPEGYANLYRSQFILANTTYNSDGSKTWNCALDDIEYSLLDGIAGEMNSANITQGQIRELARTDPWRSYWTAGKDNLFGKPVVNWSEEQKSLVSYSKMYDNIFDHGECPSDEIVEDDDMLDGWMISMRRKNEQLKKDREIEALAEKHKDAGEIFLPAQSPEEAKKIRELNNAEAMMIIKQREAAIKQAGGRLNEQDMPDVQLDKALAANN